MYLEETTDIDLITAIITEPKLWELEYGQGMAVNDFKVDNNYKYLLIKDYCGIIGMFQVRDLTRILLEAHIYLLPQYWGQHYSFYSIKALQTNYSNTHYSKIITDVPQVCKHVIKLMKTVGAKQCGFIPDGVIYNNRLTGLILYSYDLRDNK